MSLLEKKVGELLPQEIELIKEAASALARCGEKLEKALQQLQQAEGLLDDDSMAQGTGNESVSKQVLPSSPFHGEAPPPTPTEAMAQYRKAREKAETAHHTYLIQREAIGLRNHRFVRRIYPLPPKRRMKK